VLFGALSPALVGQLGIRPRARKPPGRQDR
jgi:hypothetical protein